ncbi:MAG: ribose-phosphate pyrophosphokinase-like domain-containing protein [Bacteroidetes bacterium]|nr:ribose-phosphate pyrophosphokinase-like domain-containing protein [Bacteroidota bacterium]
MEQGVYQDLRIFSGNAHPVLAKAICSYLQMPLGACEVSEFSNENVFVRIEENVRQRDVFIVQPMVPPVHTRIMELLIMIDAMKRASAGRVTAVVPYYAYGRSDKKDQPRVPITARLMANLIENLRSHYSRNWKIEISIISYFRTTGSLGNSYTKQ